jgi:hypothetical protein
MPSALTRATPWHPLETAKRPSSGSALYTAQGGCREVRSVESTPLILQPARIRVGERYLERTNPTLEVLLAVIDEVEELIHTHGHFSKP